MSEETDKMTKEERNKYWKDREVGAIWQNDDSDSLFLVLEEGGVKRTLKAYRNPFKETNRHPAWRLYKLDEMPQAKQLPKERVAEVPPDDPSDDDPQTAF